MVIGFAGDIVVDGGTPSSSQPPPTVPAPPLSTRRTEVLWTVWRCVWCYLATSMALRRRSTALLCGCRGVADRQRL